MNKKLAAALVGAFVIAAGPLWAADAAKVKKVFNKCKACHVVNKTKNKVGPHLKGIIGRQAASVEGYKYSKAMKASGLVWDDATLAAYLKKPRKFVKGTKMAFAGLRKDKDIANVIAYLKEAAQ